MVEVVPVSAYPVPDEINGFDNDVIINFDDVKKSLEDLRNANHKVYPNLDLLVDNEKEEISNKGHLNDDTGVESHKHDKHEAHKDPLHSPSEKSVTSPKSPTSIYTVGGSNKHPKLELKDREVSTRQCKFEIGEEWEQFQIIHDKSISCPPSPLIGRKHDYTENGGRVNSGYAASEPGAEIDQDLSDPSEKTKDPFPFHFLFTSASASPLKECHIIPNPFNKVNQRFHSTLQCPCFLFFFFLCCLPAVHFMQQSDRQFKKGNNKRAKNYGMMSTSFYIVGTIVGIAFLVVSIYFAADYVRQFV